MILQSLVRHYEDLYAQNLVSAEGWSLAKISYVLEISDMGELLQAICVKYEVKSGKRTNLVPQEMELPAPQKRGGDAIKPDFLWGSSAYLLGISSSLTSQKAEQRFIASREMYKKLLNGCKSPSAKALVNFYENFLPETASEHPALAENLADILGSNLVFRHNGQYLHEIPELREIWLANYFSDENAEQGVCLVTGKKDSIATLHRSVKGIKAKKTMSNGWTLVSFNEPAYCSYGHKKGGNAPTGRYAAYAYAEALIHLLADTRHVHSIADTTVLFFADGGESAYQDSFNAVIADDEKLNESDYNEIIKRLCRGEAAEFDSTMLDPKRPFYVLGISPNAARLSVRFFLRNTFGQMLKNVQEHEERMEIILPKTNKYVRFSIQSMIKETVRKETAEDNTQNKHIQEEDSDKEKKNKNTASSLLAGEILRSILNNTPYPTTLINYVSMRIRAEANITPRKAAIIKAYYLKNKNPDVPKEVLTVALNKECTNVPYTLGRLFSVIENIQMATSYDNETQKKRKGNKEDKEDGEQEQNKETKSTIRDKYFSSASSSPASVFPTMVNLTQYYLQKIGSDKPGMAVRFNKQLGELFDILGESYPARLNLAEQGSFQIGYYHQTQERYKGKENKEQE